MTAKKRLVLVATDGNRAIRLVWLRVKSDGIYGSFFHSSIHMHKSYHRDGTVHMKYEGPMQNVGNVEEVFKETGYSRDGAKGPPLDSFTGYFPFLQGISRLDADCFERLMPYDFRTGDCPLIVDSRSIQGEQLSVNYHLDLIEVGSYEILSKRMAEYQHIFTNAGMICEHHCYLEFEPWVLVNLAYLKEG